MIECFNIRKGGAVRVRARLLCKVRLVIKMARIISDYYSPTTLKNSKGNKRKENQTNFLLKEKYVEERKPS